jgi:nuclease HARBI1
VRRQHFHRLLSALRLPDDIRTDNWSVFRADNALLIFLRRMGETAREANVAQLTGRDRSAVSRIVKYVACYIVKMWWAAAKFDPKRLNAARLAHYARSIRERESSFHQVVGFLDGTRQPVASSTDPTMQRASYNKKYGPNMAWQYATGPDGLCIDMFGPVNGSRHDSAVFSRSQLESSWKALCPGPRTYQLYSDSAYPASFILLKKIKNLTDRGKLAFNKQMSSLRISVEWAFGYIGKKVP